MSLIAQLKAATSPAQRAFYEFLWAYYLEHKSWPSTWHVYRTHLEKPKLTKVLAGARYDLHSDNNSSHPRTFGLSLLGILITNRGEEYRRWLTEFFVYLRDRFYAGEDSQAVVTQSEAQRVLKLSEPEAAELGHVLHGGFMGLHPSWQPNAAGWQMFLPCHALEDFPKKGSLKREVDSALRGQVTQAKRKRRNRIPPLASLPLSSLGEMAIGERVEDSRRYQVFVSSPYVDLREERRLVAQALLEIGCFPAGMELFPAASMEQWRLIKNVIDESDYYVVFTAAKYGTLVPGKIFSYTEREFDYARKIGKPILAFYHADPGKIVGEKTEPTGVGKGRLKRFVTKLQTGRLCRPWSNGNQLADAVKTSLLQAFKTHRAAGWVRAG